MRSASPRRRRTSDPGYSVGAASMNLWQLMASEQLYARAKEYKDKMEHIRESRRLARESQKPELNRCTTGPSIASDSPVVPDSCVFRVQAVAVSRCPFVSNFRQSIVRRT